MGSYLHIAFIVFPFFFVGMWFLVSKMLYGMSGWAELAERFHFPGPFVGTCYPFQSARLKKVNYNSCLTMGMNHSGLYLVPFILFRAFHKPLLIPWSEIAAEPFKKFLFKGYRLTFGSFPDITLDVCETAFLRMRPYLEEQEDLAGRL